MGGAESVRRLADAARVAPGQHVLDVGSGLGGPARLLARERGCHVVGVDLSGVSCAEARNASKAPPDTKNARIAGGFPQEDRSVVAPAGGGDDPLGGDPGGLFPAASVDFVRGDVTSLPFGDGSFDVVWSQHVTMNVADKAAFFREQARVLRIGGLMAVHEVCRGAGKEPLFPVPWASDRSLSYLCTSPELEGLARIAGMESRIWRDATPEAIEWADAVLTRVEGTAHQSFQKAGLGDKFTGLRARQHGRGRQTRGSLWNLRRNLIEGRLAVVEGVLAAQKQLLTSPH